MFGLVFLRRSTILAQHTVWRSVLKGDAIPLMASDAYQWCKSNEVKILIVLCPEHKYKLGGDIWVKYNLTRMSPISKHL